MKYYCGPYYFNKRVKKVASWVFNSACFFHDNSYANQESKLRADMMFLAYMLQTLLEHLKTIIISSMKLISGLLLMPLFFVLVIFFGFISYRKAKENIMTE